MGDCGSVCNNCGGCGNFDFDMLHGKQSDALKELPSLNALYAHKNIALIGPPGVGKTQLVKVLSEEIFSGVEPLIRLDMSEYMEKHSVSKIIGSPPGYVGFDDAGQLTEKIRRRPYSVILFDEIEKAHPDVMNILLQILDEGRITDSHGKKVNFENTIICMTSNAGSSTGESGMGFGKTTGDLSKEKAMKALKEFLRPEFLRRVDEVVVFSPLTEENYADIAKLQLEDTAKALAENGEIIWIYTVPLDTVREISTFMPKNPIMLCAVSNDGSIEFKVYDATDKNAFDDFLNALINSYKTKLFAVINEHYEDYVRVFGREKLKYVSDKIEILKGQ